LIQAAELLAAKTRGRAPTAVTFQVTDRCHLRCVHCYETHDTKGELSLEEIERILAEIAGLGTMFLTLTGGEFFMRRDAEEILRAARRHRFAVKLLTTGWFIDERRADLIRDLGSIQVELSFYAGDPCVHDAIADREGSWQRTLDAAKRLVARKVTVLLKSPVMAPNAEALEGVIRIAEELGCKHAFDPKVTGREDGELAPTRLRASDEQLREVYGGTALGFWEQIQKPYRAGVERNPLDQTPCRAATDVCGISPEGLVSACHTIPTPAGDLRTQSFAEIWRESPQLRQLRALTWARIDECNVCDVRPYCSRCHGMALLEDGKLDGPSREACRHAVILRDLLRERDVIPGSETALPPGMQARRRLRVVQ
jgi:radical SAM protein with 4Fe4S-binding SPASM domain